MSLLSVAIEIQLFDSVLKGSVYIEADVIKPDDITDSTNLVWSGVWITVTLTIIIANKIKGNMTYPLRKPLCPFSTRSVSSPTPDGECR